MLIGGAYAGEARRNGAEARRTTPRAQERCTIERLFCGEPRAQPCTTTARRVHDPPRTVDERGPSEGRAWTAGHRAWMREITTCCDRKPRDTTRYCGLRIDRPDPRAYSRRVALPPDDPEIAPRNTARSTRQHDDRTVRPVATFKAPNGTRGPRNDKRERTRRHPTIGPTRRESGNGGVGTTWPRLARLSR